jgi:hypothetical protein
MRFGRAIALFPLFACGDSARAPVAPIFVADQTPAPPASSPVAPEPAPSHAAPSSAPPPAASASPAAAENGAESLGGDAGTPGPSVDTAARIPSLRQGAPQVTGKLPPEVIQRIVRQHFGRFHLCYENGLRTNPKLAGTVKVRFTISKSGDVSQAADSGSDLPDKGVVACVVKGFANVSFPQPDSGAVIVVYPIVFAPGGETPKR